MSSRVLVAIRVGVTPDRAFAAFTQDIALWWRPNAFFAFTPRSPGVLSFEAGADGRLIERLPNGGIFEVGKVQLWDPPRRLVFCWRQATFPPGVDTRVEIRFEPTGNETRVTVEHSGWDGVPIDHVARHGLENAAFLRRHGQWWQGLLSALNAFISAQAAAEGDTH